MSPSRSVSALPSLALLVVAAACVPTGEPPVLVRLDPEPSGVHCPEGGTAVRSGVDHNRNGVLDELEVDAHTWVCHERGAGPVLTRVRDEPEGANCAAGGKAVDAGIDLDLDGTLSDDEVRATSYLCNDAGPAPLCPAGPPGAGIALSFDDDFVDQWYAAREVFQKYGARVTFYVTRADRLNADRIRKLRELAEDGHEIGYHGLTHVNPAEYAAEHGARAYVDAEVTPGMEALAAHGFHPTTFAYPWGGRTPELDALLLEQFTLLRGSSRVTAPTRTLETIGAPRLIYGASIDSSRATTDEALAFLDLAAEQKRIAVMYTHRITEEEVTQSHIRIGELDRVLAHACSRGLKFHTMEDLAHGDRPGREVMYAFFDGGSIATADQIVRDEWPIPRFAPVHLAWPYTWEEDPFGEKYWQFIFYSLRETRHLLYAYGRTGDVKYLRKIEEVFTHFEKHGKDKPFAKEKHGAAFRAMTVVNTYWKLKRAGVLTPAFEATLRSLVAHSGAFLADPRNFEGGYNHGVTQAAGLLLVGENFPDLPEGATWKALGITRLDGILRDTVDADGAQVEQSPFYHFYTLRMFWEVDAWAKLARVDLGTSPLHETVMRMLRFGAYVVQPDGQIPLLGSSTRLDFANSYKDLAAGGSLLDEHFAFVVSRGKNGRAPAETSRLFPTAGFAMLRSGFGDATTAPLESQVIFDVGPYRTNHSHLDALHLHYYSAGRALLVDSGLFTYETGPEKAYYWGTRAHNTVVVDGLDQRTGTAKQGRFLTGEGWAWQSGSHDLYTGVEHRRGVLLLERDLLLVVDRLVSTLNVGSHTFEQSWHLFPGAEVTRAGLAVEVRDENGDPALSIAQGLPAGLALTTVKGGTNPRNGWYSIDYEVEQPAWALSYERTGTDATYVTAFGSGPLAGRPLSVAAEQVGDTLEITVTVDGVERRVQLGDLALPTEQLTIE